jgi:Flp pilus assembly protein TadG
VRKRRRSGRRSADNLSTKQRGVAAVEFAVASGLFFTLLLGVVDWSYLFFTNLSMQHAVREGARYAVTGQSGLSKNPGDRCDAVRAKIREQSMGLYDRTDSTTVFKTIDAAGNIVTLGSDSCYGANQIIVVEVNSTHSPITPVVKPFFGATGGKYLFSVSTTMKNEAFQ